MTALKIDLEWGVDSKGYELVDHGEHGVWIVGKGGKLRKTRPLARNDMHFQVFSEIRNSLDVLRFVKNYGLLNSPVTHEGGDTFSVASDGSTKWLGPSSLHGESVSEHIETASLMRRVMKQAPKGWQHVPRSLDLALSLRFHEEPLAEIGLIGDRSRGIRLTFKTNSLMNAVWLQLAHRISGGAKFESCEFCGQLFETGPGTGRRTNAKYCCEDHRIKFNSRKRSDADK